MWQTIEQIDRSALAVAIRSSTWTYPVVEMVHIGAFAALFGSLLLLELRVFGAAPDLALRPLSQIAVRTALFAFALAASTGLLLWISDALRLSGNPAFVTKLSLIVLAGANAAFFHARDSVRRHDRVARAQAAISLLLWIAVIGAGRLIAYV